MPCLSCLITSLAPWHWLAFGLVLLIGECLLPGSFLLFVGSACLVTGGITALLPHSSWETHLLIFAPLTLVFVYLGSKWYQRCHDTRESSLLTRLEGLKGQRFQLQDPIIGGKSRLRIGDSFWTIQGPDLPAGHWVQVMEIEGNVLKVELAP